MPFVFFFLQKKVFGRGVVMISFWFIIKERIFLTINKGKEVPNDSFAS